MIFGIMIPNFIMLITNDMVEIYCFHLLIKHFFTLKYWVKENINVYYVFLVLEFFIMLACNIPGNTVANAMSFIGCFVVPCLIFTEYKSSLRGFMCYALYVMASSLIEYITFIVSLQFLKNGNRYEAFASPQIALASILAKYVFVVLMCVVGSKEKDPIKQQITLIFAIFPIATIVLYYTMFYSEYMTEQMIPGAITVSLLFLLLNIMLFFVVEKMSAVTRTQYKLKEKTIKLESQTDILEIAAKSMRERLDNADEVMEKDRVMRHDRRHFEGLLLTLLEAGKIEEAEKLLRDRLAAEPCRTKKWCENNTVNAAIDYYIKLAEREDIACKISMDIPTKIKVDDLDLAIVLGNLIENAIHACIKLEPEHRNISIKSRYKDQLLIEIENTCTQQVCFDDAGYPLSNENGHGVGTKSVKAFIEKTDSVIFYSLENQKFTVRMIVG